MDETEMLNIELNELNKEDIGKLYKNSLHKLWMKIIRKINSFQLNYTQIKILKNSFKI